MLEDKDIEQKKKLTADWFTELRNQIRIELESLEELYCKTIGVKPTKFVVTPWKRDGGGGGEISLLKGQLFEKAGVNFSAVWGEFSEEFRHQIPGASEDPSFFATGISLVIHPKSPLVPIVHMNTRFIATSKTWFGGGADLTPCIVFDNDKKDFHQAFKNICDKHNSEYYPKFKDECDKYFYLPHRKEPRGIGGIFYDYLNSGSFDKDFAFTKDVGLEFKNIYPKIVKRNMFKSYDVEDERKQSLKRSRYVEFNLLYDRGTKFGLMTGGNTEAILMSLPPSANWN